jgi:hypothetical protein
MNFLDIPESESVFIDANVFVYAFAADPTLGPPSGLTHHNSESGLAGKPCLLVKSKLLDHILATFR